MRKKGFTLIKILLGLFLLGLIFISLLPILTSSYINLSKNKVKLEMNYIGEMTIEKIKSFDNKNPSEIYIFNKNVEDIIELFKKQNFVELNLNKEVNGEKYLLKIIKRNRSMKLWMIESYVFHDKEETSSYHVEYKTYILQK